MAIKQFLKSCYHDVINGWERFFFNLRNDIHIGENSKIRFAKINSNVQIGSCSNISGGKLESYSYLGDCCELPQTKIGKFCSIASHVKLAAGNHPLEYVSTSPYTYAPITWSLTNRALFDKEFFYVNEKCRFLCQIDNDVWIGMGAILVCGHKALHIGNGAVIAAGAVVTKDVPPYAVVAGNPAKIVRYRFSQETVQRLQEMKWWNKDVQWIRKNVPLFSTPQLFIKGKC